MNRKDLINSVGSVVSATDPQYGTYVGVLLKAKYNAEIEIMSCLTYPTSQRAIDFNVKKERRPYQQGERVCFAPESVQLYTGEVAEYEQSVREALRKAVNKAEGEELIVLHRHYTEERVTAPKKESKRALKEKEDKEIPSQKGQFEIKEGE